MAQSQQRRFYQAFLARDTDYEGLFYAAIKTTGIYCRPTCPARKARPEHCEFFSTTDEAEAAGYRPCLRCNPKGLPQAMPLVDELVKAVEQNPQKRWREEDFRALGADASTVRRQFKKRFGVTFVAYARAHKMGRALDELNRGKPVLEAQLEAGFESGSGFREAFNRLFGTAPIKGGQPVFYVTPLETPLGPMMAIADENALQLLDFTDRKGLEAEINKLRAKTGRTIIPGQSPPLKQIKTELEQYFSGALKTFQTPLALHGTPFQQATWQALMQIPYGETRSYAAQAAALNKPSAVRAVARANGCNQLAIIIPCHRVVGADGKLTGYAGGLARKQWLLEHEVKLR